MVGETVVYIKYNRIMEGIVLDKYSGITREETLIGVGDSRKHKVSNPIATDFYMVQPNERYANETGDVDHIECKKIIRIVQT